MGANASQLEKEIGHDQFPSNEHYFGLVNFGNTCYCNSVLQALYFCKPFREKVLDYKAKNKRTKETLLTCLADLFYNIATQKKKTGTIAPKKFIARLRKENGKCSEKQQGNVKMRIATQNGEQQQPASKPEPTWVHDIFQGTLTNETRCLNCETKYGDFLSAKIIHKAMNAEMGFIGESNGSHINLAIFNLLMQIVHEEDYLIDVFAAEKQQGNVKMRIATQNGEQQQPASKPEPTWVHDIFQGTLTNETRCLNCETVSSKDEDFLDLSVDVNQNTSITHCLRGFSNTETLCSEHKYYCENCCSKQEAQKRMRVKKLPMILALHLKRFKYMEQQNRHTKLSYRVVFPLELRLFNTSDDAYNPDRLYDLVAVVIHCGSGPNRGHYISIVKSHGLWLLFDDDIVDKIDASAIEDFYGLTSDTQKTSESGYILFYQSKE
nr:ubiquitin carboxyl-terminal hydrolase 46 [Parasteatoda tepidariorum]